MCGIVGYVGTRSVVPLLLKGLQRLEYRGYDSAGLAFYLGEHLEIRKSEGKLENVEKLLLQGQAADFALARCGMGHTRWATHGKPTTQNAHPHRVGHVVLVHNGIIENYQEIKRELIARGHRPQSETDSELFGFLVLEQMDLGSDLATAIRLAFAELQGACSVVVMSEREPGRIVGVRNGAPLVIALDPQGGVFFASDAQPILEYTKRVIFLENRDVAIADSAGLKIVDLTTGERVARSTTELDWSPEKMDKQGYAHYMLKEIFEQPVALVDTLNGLMDRAKSDPFPLARTPAVDILDRAQAIMIVACGTSWHAATVAKYWIEQWAGVSVQVDLASEFRYRRPVIQPGTVVLGMSQSGETADTLAVIRELKNQRVPTLGLTNVRGSTLAREANGVFFTSAGPEIGVAATKTFSTQLLALLLFAGYLGIQKKVQPVSSLTLLFDQILRLPHHLEAVLTPDGLLVESVRAAARMIQGSKGFFFIGRGSSFPIALEGALKLKEIAYVHAEGYAAGELKHGPIAMIDPSMTVVVLAPRDRWRDKTVSNLEEVKARGARVVGMGMSGDTSLQNLCDFWIPLDSSPGATEGESLFPFELTVAIQLLSYELACLKGTDVDKPRNLAKSVTVE